MGLNKGFVFSEVGDYGWAATERKRKAGAEGKQWCLFAKKGGGAAWCTP
jgi:hypothetical protein